MRILITGPTGSGKTHVSAALRSEGVNAVDADTVPRLCGWFNKRHGHPVSFPLNADKAFLDNNEFLWIRTALEEFLKKHETLYLFGIARNWSEMVPLFDKVYFLRAKPELLTNRLRNASRKNPMGRTAYQLEYSCFWAAKNEEFATRLGIEMIDADQTPAEIFARIRVPSH